MHNFAFANFQGRVLNSFFVIVTGLSMGVGVVIALPSENSYLEILQHSHVQG